MPSANTTGPWKGVPDPPFGLTETAPARPSPWTSAQAGYYYVNGTTGTDTANTYGWPANPRKTIPEVLAAGAYVEVHGTDDKSYTNPHQIVTSGTALSPVWIRGQDTSTRPTFTSDMCIRGTYTIVEYITFNAPEGGLQLSSGDHVVVRHSEFTGVAVAHSSGLAIAYDFAPFDAISYMVIWDCAIHDEGDWLSSADDDNHGVAITAGDHHWVLGCEFSHCSGDSVQINGGVGGGADLHHIYVAGNHSHHNRQTGGWAKQSTDVIFSENIVHDCRPGSGGSGVGLGGQYAPNRVWYLFNTIYNCDFGIGLLSDDSGHGASDAIYYIGNVIYDITDSDGDWDPVNSFTGGAFQIRGSKYHILVNNTIFRAVHGICFSRAALFPSVYGNIVDTVDTTGRHLFLSLDFPDTETNLQGNGNVFAPNFRYSVPSVTGQTNPIFLGTDKVVFAAGFLDKVQRDFHLTTNSPAIDSESTDYSSVYDLYETTYGVNIQTDITGLARPVGAKFDAGAYESTTPLPLPVHEDNGSASRHMPYLEINGNPSFDALFFNGTLWAHNTFPAQADVNTGLNTFVGLNAGNRVLSGADSGAEGIGNSGFGQNALAALTVGTLNTAVGASALKVNTDGSENTALGAGALGLNVSGIRNTALGASALNENTGESNLGIGDGAGRGITSGSSNICIGVVAGYNNGALNKITTGKQNIIVGNNSGQSTTAQLDNTILIGHGITASTSGQTVIGHPTNSTAVTIYGLPTNASLNSTLVDPAGSSTTAMCGFGGVATLTPTVTGRVTVWITGTIGNTSTAVTGGGTVTLRYGTGTAPTNGTASTGTILNGAKLFRGAGSSAGLAPFMVGGMLQGLTLNTAYWFDVQQAALLNTSTTALSQCAVTIIEM